MMQHAVAGGISGVLIVAVVAIPLGFIMVVLHRRTAATRRAIQVDVPHSTVLTMSVESSSPEAKRWLRQLPASDKVRVRLIFHLAVSPSEVRLFGPRSTEPFAIFASTGVEQVAIASFRPGVRRFPAIRIVLCGRELVMLGTVESRINGLRTASRREIEAMVADLHSVLGNRTPPATS